MRNLASKETISDSVELCDTHVRFLHIKLFGKHVWLPNMHNVLTEVDFEPSMLDFPHDYIVCTQLCNECKRSYLPDVCHMLCSIL